MAAIRFHCGASHGNTTLSLQVQPMMRKATSRATMAAPLSQSQHVRPLREFLRAFLGARLKAVMLPIAVVAFAASSSGCAKANIINTDVTDTDENRKVIEFCENYRHAVEERNVTLLLKLASDRYYEDGGNTDVSDDMDYNGLKDYLATKFLKTSAIRYEIRYRKISVSQRNDIYVDYTYSASYRIPGSTGDEWRHSVAENRLVLVPVNDAYRIVSGM
jgi:hypothetical protein